MRICVGKRLIDFQTWMVRPSIIAIPAAMLALMTPIMLAQAGGGFQLQPFTAPDGSASAGVPPGWRVTAAKETLIVMEGPNQETIYLGKDFLARNAPYQVIGQPGGIDLNMPYQAALGQKFQMIVMASSSADGVQAQVHINSASPIQAPAALGQCGRFFADINGKDAMKSEALLCSLPMDTSGVYKNFFKLAQAPPSVASRERPLAEAVFASYRVPPEWLRRKLAPFTPDAALPGGTGGGADAPRAGGGGAAPGQPGFDADCFDDILIREMPPDELPAKCKQ